MNESPASGHPEVPAPGGNSSPRLDAYLARWQTPLDLLALSTLWLILVPPSTFDHGRSAAILARTALSVIYGIDMAIRSRLAPRHLDYIRHHPLGVLVVIVPPVRVLFSLRLVGSVFRRGHLFRFLVAASLMVLNGAVIVYLYEHHAAGADITTLGQSIWWSVTTVTTVGYGDYAPVTVPGRVVATGIMVIGITAIAVITAQVASTFMAQSARRQGQGPVAAAGDIEERLARIEAMLLALTAAQATPVADPDEGPTT